MNKKLIRPILLLLALCVIGAVGILLRRGDAEVQADIVAAAGPNERLNDPSGFARADAPRALSFPKDHGPHPDYQTEWWYYTGNLVAGDGRRFGYQLTFFRRALVPSQERQGRASKWGTDQVYMAHFALTDVGAGDFKAFERLDRGAAGLSGAQASPYRVWLEDWTVEEQGPNLVHLSAAQAGLSIELDLSDRKGPILQGDQGYSRKGPEPGNASYYYSLTRLETEGTVQTSSGRYEVSGLSWMDHEFSTSALSPGQVGWDWFSIQLDDGSELIVFQIRREDGTIDPFSSGTLVAKDGSTTALSKDDFEITVEDNWRSPHTKAKYPSRWKLRIPSVNLTLNLTPRLSDQELNLSYSYWEGAVEVSGQRDGKAMAGSGYVELTGYSKSMSGEF